ncbi:hypothetical protein BU17DRAFT_53348 [Hysterangium stoloniferum]|nr:hypothetical protein BU17DRAFT_59717 [Hysterangium stoloniferum]KAF8513322.1 hypothetical protein BU17DRAFT_53342 [Hysterangium stoloniferum]KAF8513323.1 hypothetical protein BU17DRAFT_53348 [Hysterangium stoloniferum]
MSSTAIFEHSFYIGSYLSGILYGLDLAMYYMTIRNQVATVPSRRSFAIYGFSTALLILVSIDVSTNAIFGEQAWITFRNTPGGPPVWILEHTGIWYQSLSTASVAGLIYMSDGFLIYRFFIIWGSRYMLIILPSLVYLAGMSMAILEIITTAVPGGTFFSRKTIKFGLPYYTLSIALNIILTSCIVGRILFLYRRVHASLGYEAARVYTGVLSILIESAALYSIIGFMTIIPYGINAPTSIAFGQVWSKLAAISPQLILFRVSSGRGWTKDTVAQVQSGLASELVFETPSSQQPPDMEYVTDYHDLPRGINPKNSASQSTENCQSSRV